MKKAIQKRRLQISLNATMMTVAERNTARVPSSAGIESTSSSIRIKVLVVELLRVKQVAVAPEAAYWPV